MDKLVSIVVPIFNLLNNYIEENNLNEDITLLGYQENPYSYVHKADLFVCSSYNEGFSTAVTESLVVGTPVVTTLCSGMEELLGTNNEFGLITKNTEDALYEGMVKLINSPKLLEYYRNKAVERGQEFSLENTIKATENLFDSL